MKMRYFIVLGKSVSHIVNIHNKLYLLFPVSSKMFSLGL